MCSIRAEFILRRTNCTTIPTSLDANAAYLRTAETMRRMHGGAISDLNKKLDEMQATVRNRSAQLAKLPALSEHRGRELGSPLFANVTHL